MCFVVVSIRSYPAAFWRKNVNIFQDLVSSFFSLSLVQKFFFLASNGLSRHSVKWYGKYYFVGGINQFSKNATKWNSGMWSIITVSKLWLAEKIDIFVFCVLFVYQSPKLIFFGFARPLSIKAEIELSVKWHLVSQVDGSEMHSLPKI